jgi:hypothetical protein
MSEFPEIEPFGPHRTNDSETAEISEERIEPAAPPEARSNCTALVVTAFGVGFFVGYLVFRNEERILSQTKLDQFFDYANDWVRQKGPKIADPIRHSLESTGSSVGQALKTTGSSVDDLIKKVRSSLFH